MAMYEVLKWYASKEIKGQDGKVNREMSRKWQRMGEGMETKTEKSNWENKTRGMNKIKVKKLQSWNGNCEKWSS